MKTRNLLTAVALMISIVLVAQPTNARQGKRDGQQGVKKSECRIPNLTDDQSTKIEAFKIAHLKEVQPLMNKMGELKAKQKSLTLDQ